MKKRILSVALIATMLSTLLMVPAMAKAFPDSAGHWAENAISVWSDRGIVNGDDAGNFRPGDPITRGETAKLMDNLIGFQRTSNKVFSDVAVSDWYAAPISKLFAAKVLTGYEDGTIRPTASISRQEAAVIIGRAFSVDTAKANTDILAQFGDNGSIQDWARPIVAYMAECGFIQGSDGVFRPGDPITRAEVVTILNNMVGLYVDSNKTDYTGNFGNKLAIIKSPANLSGVVLGGAVVCATVKGKVNFNSGSKVNGCLCNWSENASVSTAGATVASTSNKNGGTITAGGNYSSGYGTGSMGGSMGGGSMGGGSMGGSSNTRDEYSVTYYANGGRWTNPIATEMVKNYISGRTYGTNMPINPIRDGYSFEGWYTSQNEANGLVASAKIKDTDPVNYYSSKILFAGWKQLSGQYGTLKVATDPDLTDFGMPANALMDNVTLTETGTADSFAIKGGLHYLLDPQSNLIFSVTEGNFLALTYTLPNTVTNPEDAELTYSYSDGSDSSSFSGFTSGKKSKVLLFSVTDADLTKDIVVSVDLDGDGKIEQKILVDLSALALYKFRTATTLEEFKTYLADKTTEKLTVNGEIKLTSGTYAPVGKTALVLNQPLQVEKDAEVVLENMTVQAGALLESLLKNTEEGEPAEATKATSVTLKNIIAGGENIAKMLNNVNTKTLVVKNCEFTGDGSNTALALPALEEGDTVTMEDTTFDGFAVALESADGKPLTEAGNSLKKNIFKNNTADIKLGVADAIPNLAYNYFDGEPVITGTNGGITNYYGPLYTEETMGDTQLTENLHDAYVFVDGTLEGKLSALSGTGFSLTFADENATHEITVVPTDARDTVVTIGGESKTSVTLGKTDMPAELTIKIGDGEAKIVTVTEPVSE